MTDLRILIVDDDREMRKSLLDLAAAAGFEASALPRAAEVARSLARTPVDVILSDIRMPGMTGLDLLDSLAGTEAPPIVLISAHGDIPMAVAAMQAGAYSFVEKPFDPRRLLRILQHAAEQHRMRMSNARLRDRLMRLSGLDRVFLGQNSTIANLRDDIVDFADSPANLLITGETGTGKEVVARALHDLGPASGGPFVAVAGAQMTAETANGILLQADGGTLFLDEVTTCPDIVQALLLRCIETKTLIDGETGQSRRLDMRVVAASNEDAAEAISAGRLRPDLHFRLSTLQMELPPLRQRRDDIALLATHFLGEAARSCESVAPDLTEEDLSVLLSHDWPGNARELRNVCERRVLMARRGGGSMAAALHPANDGEDIPHTLREAVAAFEREMIGKAIRAHGGRMDAVAEALGIGRRTLNEKVVKLGLDKDSLI